MIGRVLLIFALFGLCLASCGRQCYDGSLTMANPSGATDGTSCDSATECRATFQVEVRECGASVDVTFALSDQEIVLDQVEMVCEPLAGTPNVVVEITDEDNTVSLLWQYADTTCDGILTMLSTPRGIFQTGQAKVAVQGNIWSADLERLNQYEVLCGPIVIAEGTTTDEAGSSTSAAPVVPSRIPVPHPVPSSIPHSVPSFIPYYIPVVDQTDVDEEYHTSKATKPVVPFVECSVRLSGTGLCCTWFGYENKANATVILSVGKPRNYLTDPKSLPITQSNQPSEFYMGKQEWDWFVLWDCDSQRQEIMRWDLEIEGLGSSNVWSRSASVSRNRNDCNSTWTDICKASLV